MFPTVVALVCLGAAACLPANDARIGSQQPPASTLDLNAYVAELGRCSRELRQIEGNPSAISRFRQSLPREWIVFAGSARFRVSNAWLDVALAGIERPGGKSDLTLHDALRRLEFLRAQAVELEGPAPALSAASAQPQLDAILRGREFRGLRPPSALAIWWHKLLVRIAGWLERLYALLHLGALSGNVLAYALLAVALSLLAFWWWRGLARRAPPGETPAAGLAPPDSRQWLGEALAAADRGDYREAIHCGYWAGIGRLVDAGALPRDRSLTPRERLHLLAVHRQEANQLSALTSRFELVWYGYRPPSAGDWQITKAELEKMGCSGLSTAAIARS